MRASMRYAGTILVLSSLPCRAQITRRVSVGPGGHPANLSCFQAVISDDGRCVAYYTEADNLVPGDTNGRQDVFVHDRTTGATERVSVGSDGEQGNHDARGPSISGDGRFVAFQSTSWTYVPGDDNLLPDVFVRDRATGRTRRVSVAPDGTESNASSGFPSLSPDGRFVAFPCSAANLVVPDANAFVEDVLVHDRWTGILTRESVASDGAQANGWSDGPCLSAGGRFVAFRSAATNLVPGDTNGHGDVFVRDRQSGETSRISVATGGAQADGHSYAPAISADGRFVAFGSTAPDLVAGDANGEWDGFVRDRWTGTTRLVTVGAQGVQGNGLTNPPRIASDGSAVVFGSWATNLLPMHDGNGIPDLFVRELFDGPTGLVNVAEDGGLADVYTSSYASLSADGRLVAFESAASNLVPGSNGANQIYVRDRRASGFTSLCDPGSRGVVGCPCANPPSGGGRGCDNAAGTGGAALAATGSAYLTWDELVFTTSGENPSALSVLLQGDAAVPAGLPFGRGVRCAGGSVLRRLYVRAAVGGGIAVPDPMAGEPAVSQRSAQLGDAIEAGGSRWYVVWYRDAPSGSGCSGVGAFNATQTGRIDWSF